MKKNIFFAVAAIMMALCTACENKSSSGETTTPLEGSEYTIVTTAKGAMGLKLGDKVIIEPSDNYKNFAVDHGMIVAETEANLGDILLKKKELINPSGHVCLTGDSISYREDKGGYFETKSGGNWAIYLPGSETTFGALSSIAFDDKNVVTKVLGKTGVFTTKKDTLVVPSEDFFKICLYKGTKKVLVKMSDGWGFGTINADKDIDLGNAATAADLKKARLMKGWDEKSDAMILE